MKKQFFRVKQLADQTFLRADRSECLNQDELKKADYKVEYISKAFSEIIKKLPTSLAAPEVSEKRKKKYFEFGLGTIMQELVNGDEHDKRDRMLLQNILRECGDAEMRLVEDLSSFECEVEQYVSSPINNILEKELPNIYKQKKNLNKYILDKDSAKNRYQNATKNGTMKDNLKEDMDEADIKVDQSRDTLAAEMFGLLRKEHEMCIYLLQLLKMQRSYHESALKTLETVIPTLEQRIGDSEIKPIFGCDLIEHLKITKRKIAFPLELCILALTELGMSEEGLFRVVGGASRVKRLKFSIDSGCFSLPLIHEYRDVHVLASTLKSYLRELPEPLLTYSLHNEWMESMRYPEEQRLHVIQDIMRKMPTQNRDNLGFLIQFLAKLSKNPENKMTSSNIAIVMSPNLLWANQEEINMHMKNCATINMIVELLINNVDSLFPEELMKHATIRKSELFYDYETTTSLKMNNVNIEQHENFQLETASPRLVHRRKGKPAPAPPGMRHDGDYYSDMNHQEACTTFNSNTLPLARSKKDKSADYQRPKPKTVENCEEEISERRSSLIIEDKSSHNKVEIPNPSLVNLDDTKVADHKFLPAQTTTNTQITKSKPVQQITAQITNVEIPVMSNNLQKSSANNTDTKPVAAPRTSILQDVEKPIIPNQIVRRDSMSKSLNSIDIDGETVQTRRPITNEVSEKPNKPAIPVRPASLRTPAPRTLTDFDPAIHKTQCSVYNMPPKQQPSIVTIQTRTFAAGHDSQIAEKEKFLGHQPNIKPITIENKYSDINSNCDVNKSTITKPDVPTKPPIMKSNEKLNLEPIEKVNGNSKTSHVRTRSDGNIVDVQSDGFSSHNLLQTPPSPRSLNKPSQPPPPPPTAVKTKSEPETTNF